jgi:hypothetical protein
MHVVDNDRRLLRCGLVDLIEKNELRIDDQGCLFTPDALRIVEIGVQATSDSDKRRIAGGDVICSFNDGTTERFRLQMKGSRIGFSRADPAEIGIIPGPPIGLTPRQCQQLGYLLRLSFGKQLALRTHVKRIVADHPAVRLAMYGGATGAAVGAAMESFALPSLAKTNGAIGPAIGMLLSSLLLAYREPRWDRSVRRHQMKVAEALRSSARRRL